MFPGVLVGTFSMSLEIILGCGNRSLRIKHHGASRNLLFHYLLPDNKGLEIEQRCSAENFKRPGDLYHPDFLEGCPAFFDVSVRNSLQPSHIILDQLQRLELMRQI